MTQTIHYYQVPHVVSVVFNDGKVIVHHVCAMSATDDITAAAAVVADYYCNGGTLPLQAVRAVVIDEATCRAAVKVYDEIARDKAAREAEDKAKVVHLASPPEPAA